jgi:hypothetical protein
VGEDTDVAQLRCCVRFHKRIETSCVVGWVCSAGLWGMWGIL